MNYSQDYAIVSQMEVLLKRLKHAELLLEINELYKLNDLESDIPGCKAKVKKLEREYGRLKDKFCGII